MDNINGVLLRERQRVLDDLDDATWPAGTA
jgi:hypothetical protein